MASLAYAKLPEGVYKTEQPQWVESIEFDASEGDGSHIDDGIEYLLHSLQERLPEVGKGQRHTFIRNVWRFESSSGVAENSRIGLSFNPEFEKLQLHSINIYREDQVIDKLPEARMTLLHKETEADYLIYNGEKELDIVLSDIRVGDILEYSYSRIGENEIFENQAELIFRLNWSIFIRKTLYRVLSHSDRQLSVRDHEAGVTFQQSEKAGWTEYRLEQNNIEPILSEERQPAWYKSHAYTVFSDFSDWNDVVQWAHPLYEQAVAEAVKSEEIRSLAFKLGETLASDEEKIVATLRWVQNEVRYLGLELGESTHLPTNPVLTLQRRFGDCKDKTVLFISLLRVLGIDAQPALVDTVSGARLQHSPLRMHAFDHVLVHVPIDLTTAPTGSSSADKTSATSLWLDPTKTFQRGAIGDFVQPDFGKALILQPGTDSLVDMSNDTDVFRISVNSELYLSGAGGASASLNVNTLKSGVAAERERARFATNNRKRLEKNYQNYYSQWYGKAELLGDVVVTEEAANTTRKKERYQLEEFVSNDNECEDCRTLVYADEVLSWLSSPKNAQNRETPYVVTHPLEVDETIVISTFFDLQEVQDSDSFEEVNSFFSFSREVTTDPENRKIRLGFVFKSLVDYVEAEQLVAYEKALDRVYDQLSYDVTSHRHFSFREQLDWGEEEAYATRLFLGTLALLVLIVGLFELDRYIRKRPRTSA